MQKSMKERPILFSTEMVSAIFEGRKTQTRRVVKQFLPIRLDKEGNYAHTDKFVGTYQAAMNKCPYGQVGDRLWVRETFAEITGGHGWWYKSESSHLLKLKWKPSIFMPREASRITLEITGIRIEKLNGITELDAISEGVDRIKPVGDYMFFDYQATEKESPSWFDNAFESFRSLWYKINGRQSWESNPYVWVITFKVL
jgi:hypothetical protein